MSKKTIRKRVLAAIEKDPHKKTFKRVSLFGSYIYGNPKKNSDLDVLIEFSPRATITLFDLAEIQRNMQKSTKIKIDLVTKGGLSKFIKEEVLSKAEVIYEKR